MVKTASWPRRVWRNLYWFRQDRRTRAEYGGASRYVFFGGTGPGDDLMLSTVLHELRQRGERRLGVLTRFPELFTHSPDVEVVRPMRHDHLSLIARTGVRVDHAVYLAGQREPDIDVAPPRHILAEMCRTSGITGQIALRPYVYLSEAEQATASAYRVKPYIVMQSSRRASTVPLGTKEWKPEHFDAVARGLARHCRVVQIGQPGEPALAAAEDWRGQTTLRESAVLLAGAAGFVGLVGFLMHLARAVDCPAVIVAGGREHPRQSGYLAFTNLYSAVPCAPCWRRNSCVAEHRCMTEITPAAVIAAVERLLAAPPTRPLVAEQVIAEATDHTIPSLDV